MKPSPARARIMSVGFTGRRGMKGTLIPTTAWKRSGRSSAACPRHDRAPVVADHDRVFLSERVEHPDEVADEMEDRVGVDPLRRLGPAVPAHVRRDGVVAGRGERDELVAPRVPALGEAVAEEDERAFARFREVHRKAADVELAVADDGVVHAGLLRGQDPTSKLDFSPVLG